MQDVSRLVDLCRQSIVFDSPADLADCLGIIARDPDVLIVRVKNRLDPAYDAGPCAGYRDVALNLRVVRGDSRRLGLHLHVCEVQLVLRSFAELKVASF